MKDKNKIVFFGSDENSAKLLAELIQVDYNIELVVTKTNKKTGRSKKQNPVKKIAEQYNLNIAEKDRLNNPDSIKILKNTGANLAILLSYGTMIPEDILNSFPLGIINIHPSLLPKYRGPSPVQTTLLNGEQEAGVSIILLTKEMDAGPIIAQEKVTVEPEDNHETLNNKLFSLGNKLLMSNLEKYIKGEVQIHPQDNNQATYTQMIEKKDGLIDWNNPAENINNKIKAFYNWPGAYTYFKDKLLKIVKASFTEKNTAYKIGEVFLDDLSAGLSADLSTDLSTDRHDRHDRHGRQGNKVTIQTSKGVLYPFIVQIEGKQKMDINPFVNGYKNFIKTILKSSPEK